MKSLFKILIILFSASAIYAGTDGTIRGQVLDVEGSPIIGAQIVIKSKGLGTVADLDGNYILLNIPVGTYTVTIQMIGYQTKIIENVSVTMDQTTWLNFNLAIAAIEGEVVYVTGEKPLVEKGSTSKKITMSKEAIESLPIRDVTELYNLQSGVVKVESKSTGIPNHEERGLEEVHVRGGRSGEIAYMIDGLYIRNPIYGGIGNGTRLNKYAIQEFDWQPGGFNAEYGDALSAVSNFHTMSGGSDYSFRFQYETSLLGAELGSLYDKLRDYNDYNIGFGGPIFPGWNKIQFWISAQSTSKGAYKVLKFDDQIYDPYYIPCSEEYKKNDEFDVCNPIRKFYGGFFGNLNAIRGDLEFAEVPGDPEWDNIKHNLTFPWDNTAGFRAFGFDKTDDYFAKLTFNFTNKLKVNISYWNVDAHRKNFGYNKFLYWDDGQNEIFRDTERITAEINHTIDSKTFYTIRISQFVQEQFIGSRWQDSDNDGYPDWYEWGNLAGYANSSDPNDPNIVPFNFNEDQTKPIYIGQDGNGPNSFSSGWYFGADPGNYNWDAADGFRDMNNNGYYDFGIDVLTEDKDQDGVWDPPPKVQSSYYRDGSYWLTPEMYIDNEEFMDYLGAFLNYEGLTPRMTLSPDVQGTSYWQADNPDNIPPGADVYDFYAPLYFISWPEEEEKAYGGHDKYYSTSEAITNELRFDFTRQLTDKWRGRWGFDYKEHLLNYYEVENPWDEATAFRQRFAEQWNDFGVDGEEWTDPLAVCWKLDFGEGNGIWDGPKKNVEDPCNPGLFKDYPGESFDDFNGNDEWDDYVMPREFALYWQNTFEVPWMVINAGVRLDAVDYQTKIWADGDGNYSPYVPWFYFDCGADRDLTGKPVCADEKYLVGFDANGDEVYEYDDSTDPTQNNGKRDPDDYVTDLIQESDHPSAYVIFKDSDWLYKISPRLGISHVISDGATFTFNYGVYYQTPVYEYIYRNVSKLEEPATTFEDASREGAGIGNATMSAGRTSAYELAFNVELNSNTAVQAGIWVKDMDQLTTAKEYRSGIYKYKVAKNGDFGTAMGFDVTLNLRGKYISSQVQYTYSTAKASSEYEAAAFGDVPVDAPMQQYLMPYDRTHDLTLSLYTKKLPWGINAGLTGFYQSGYPYTALIMYGNGTQIKEDLKNRNAMRSPALITYNLSLSKDIKINKKNKVSLGVNIFNIFNKPYVVDVHQLSGKVDDPGIYYSKEIGKKVSGSHYDRPWMRSTSREINFFIGFEFN